MASKYGDVPSLPIHLPFRPFNQFPFVK